MRLGVFGGSFDPIHHAHLFAVEVAAAAFELQRVLLVPANRSPFKGQTQATASDRVAMARLAAAANPLLEVSTVDVDRPPPSYMAETMVMLAERHPGADLYLILGLDALQDFLGWREPERVLERCHIIAVSRPGHELAVPPAIAAHLGEQTARILLQPMPELAISSTEIRRRVRAGQPIRYLLPDAVERYIRERGLYRG